MFLHLGLLLFLTLTRPLAYAGPACDEPQSKVLQQSACEISQAACKERFKKDTELQTFLKTCDQKNSDQTEFRTVDCLKLIPKPMWDAVEGLATFLAAKAKGNASKIKELINECQTSIEKREMMISTVPLLKKFDLNNTTDTQCATMVTEYVNWSSQQESTKALEKLEKIGNQTFQQSLEAKNRKKAPQISQNILQIIWNDQKDKFNCLNDSGQSYLKCYYTFSVIDPTLLAGFAFKAPQLIKAFQLEGRLSKMRGAQLAKSMADEVAEVATHGPAHAKLEAKLGRPVEFDVTERSFETEVLAFDGTKRMGLLTTRYIEDEKKLKWGIGTTYDEYRNNGLSTALLEKALETHPNTLVIEVSELQATNQRAVQAALREGKKIEEAIKNSAAYRAGAALGYTEIVPGSINYQYGFSMRRPLP